MTCKLSMDMKWDYVYSFMKYKVQTLYIIIHEDVYHLWSKAKK